MTTAVAEKSKADKAEAVPRSQKKEPLQIGKSSIIVDGKEIVFNKGQKELPGMPEISRLRAFADSYVAQVEEIEEETNRLNKIRQGIMLELKNEGRADFAFRRNDATYSFQIAAADEKLKVQKKK